MYTHAELKKMKVCTACSHKCSCWQLDKRQACLQLSSEPTRASKVLIGWLHFLPEPDYVRFGYLPSQFRLSACRLLSLSVTFVHCTQPVEIFGNISTPFCSLTIHWPPCKILRRSSPGKPSVGGKTKAKYSDVGHAEGYISETVQDTALDGYNLAITRYNKWPIGSHTRRI